MNVFAKSRAGLTLTPGERAFLKLVEALIVAGLVAAIPVITPMLNAQKVDWAQVLHTAIATFTFAVLVALTKYLTAQKDPPLAAAATPIVQAAIAEIPQWAGIPSFDVVPTVRSDGAPAQPVLPTLADLQRPVEAPVPAPVTAP